MDKQPKIILHADLDAFFAAVEVRDNPSLKGKPVIVGGTGEKESIKGIVSTCSYEARKFGVRSAMSILEAKKLCPHGVFIAPDHRKYSKASKDVFEIFNSYTPFIEPLSIDEAFLDLTGTSLLFGTPLETAKKIKVEIKEKTGLTVSIGIAPNKSVAKIASDLSKPDGLILVEEKDILNFLAPLPVSKLWGVGPKAAKFLESKAVKTIGQLRKVRKELLGAWFQSRADDILMLASGIDGRAVEMGETQKSISREITFSSPVCEEAELKKVLLELSEKLGFKLRAYGYKTKTVGIKIRFPDLKYISKAHTLEEATSSSSLIYETACRLLADTNIKGKNVRLLGLRLASLCGQEAQASLFTDEKTLKEEKKDKAVDALRKRFGFSSVMPASLLSTSEPNENGD